MKRCRHCDLCHPWLGDARHRHYCQRKLQAFYRRGKDPGRDDVSEVLVRLDDAACENFDQSNFNTV